MYYEDFLSDPKSLIEYIYDVLGVMRPKSGVAYVDRTKIRRQANRAKHLADREFNAWFLENHYAVAKADAPEVIVEAEPARAVPAHEEDIARAEELTLLKSKVVALQFEIDQLTRQLAGVGPADGQA